MTMNSYAFIQLLCLGTCVIANQMRFEYAVREGEARFVQGIETDLDKDIVKYHTPAHNHILESYLMQDFKKGLQITCLPSLHQCRVRDIERETSPNAGNVTESFLHSWNLGVDHISSENATKVLERYFIEKEVFNTVILGQDLKSFYQSFGYPLFKESKIPKDAKFIEISNGHKQTRTLVVSSPLTCNNAENRYGFTNGANCHYLKVCGSRLVEVAGRIAMQGCEDKHITYPTAYHCLCCPPVPAMIDLDDKTKCVCSIMGSV